MRRTQPSPPFAQNCDRICNSQGVHLEAASRDEHSARVSYLIFTSNYMRRTQPSPPFAQNCDRICNSRGVHLEAANGDEHSARESYLTMAAVPRFLGTQVCGCV